MPSRTDRRRLTVVEVTRSRPGLAEYHAYVQKLNGRVVREAEALGFSVVRLAAADVGVDALLDLTADADAIVILGGEDIAPRFYGASGGYVAEGRHSEVADAGQIALVLRALERSTPLVGICRGHQIINVALGGTLLQHIDDSAIHRTDGVPVAEIMTGHPVELVPGSAVAAVFGAAGDVVEVQSAHHQAVAQLGEGLVVTAVAGDGSIEAIEHRTAPIIGVQWHPEAPDAPAHQLAAVLGLLSRTAAPAPALAR